MEIDYKTTRSRKFSALKGDIPMPVPPHTDHKLVATAAVSNGPDHCIMLYTWAYPGTRRAVACTNCNAIAERNGMCLGCGKPKAS